MVQKCFIHYYFHHLQLLYSYCCFLWKIWYGILESTAWEPVLVNIQSFSKMHSTITPLISLYLQAAKLSTGNFNWLCTTLNWYKIVILKVKWTKYFGLFWVTFSSEHRLILTRLYSKCFISSKFRITSFGVNGEDKCLHSTSY